MSCVKMQTHSTTKTTKLTNPSNQTPKELSCAAVVVVLIGVVVNIPTLVAPSSSWYHHYSLVCSIQHQLWQLRYSDTFSPQLFWSLFGGCPIFGGEQVWRLRAVSLCFLCALLNYKY